MSLRASYSWARLLGLPVPRLSDMLSASRWPGVMKMPSVGGISFLAIRLSSTTLMRSGRFIGKARWASCQTSRLGGAARS